MENNDGMRKDKRIQEDEHEWKWERKTKEK